MAVDYSDDEALVAALRAGDEDAFGWLGRPLPRAAAPGGARVRVDPSVADEVVQETWLAVIAGIDRFERRSSLKTWIYRILMNKARTRGVREHRTVPFSSRRATTTGRPRASRPTGSARRRPRVARPLGGAPPAAGRSSPTSGSRPPRPWPPSRDAIAELPPTQRQVISLRDIDGWTSEEVCNVLGLSQTNQRVLLHRARAKVRLASNPPRHGRAMSDHEPRPTTDLPCNLFVELVTDYLDGALAPEQRARVEGHLGICEDCASVLDQWRLVIELTGELRHDEVEAIDPATRASLHGRLPPGPQLTPDHPS